MMHTSLFGVVLALTVLGAAPAPASTSNDAQNPPLEFGFDQIVHQAETSSTLLRILSDARSSDQAARTAGLAATNPTLGYDREELDGQSEWQITLGKSFERPLGRGHERAGWDRRLAAADYERRQHRNELIADWKTGYVELRLLGDHLVRLEGLAGAVDRIVAVAGSRREAGSLSGLEHRLIRSAAYGLDVQLRQAQRERSRLLADWSATLGLPVDRPIRLTTPVRIGATPEIDDECETPLAVAALQAEAEALDHQAAARSTLLPAIEVYGGVKRFAPGQDGWTAGVAVDLPLLNRDRHEAAQLRAEKRVVEAETAAAQTRIEAEIRFLSETVATAGERLASDPDPDDAARTLESLMVSYREGTLSLDEFLGAVQTEAEALDAQRSELTDYYRHLFRLEALTGRELVRLASREDSHE